MNTIDGLSQSTIKHLDNLSSIAASLIKDGKATMENALEKAIEYDNNMIAECLDVFVDIRRGFDYSEEYTVRMAWEGFRTVRKSVINKLYKI